MRRRFSKWEEYAKSHAQYPLSEPSQLLQVSISALRPGFTLIDLGCGEGWTLLGLREQGLLATASRIVAADLARSRLDILMSNGWDDRLEVVEGDATNLSALRESSFDVAISCMVIEHVPNDKSLLNEAWRLLVPGGTLFVTSILRRKNAFWIYRRGGGFRLDPTHEREYPSEEDFRDVVDSCGFTVRAVETYPVAFPFGELLANLAGTVSVALRKRIFFSTRTGALSRIRIRAPGYTAIEVRATKRSELAIPEGSSAHHAMHESTTPRNSP